MRHDVLASGQEFGLLQLRRSSPLTIQLLPEGELYAIRHGGTLINQVLGAPGEGAMTRLYVRWLIGGRILSFPVIGPDRTSVFSFTGAEAARSPCTRPCPHGNGA